MYTHVYYIYIYIHIYTHAPSGTGGRDAGPERADGHIF